MTKLDRARRAFLQLTAAGALSPTIARALELPARRTSGTIKDVEHVVILMQENRSFDHYFGSLRGVRGFDDPHAISLPNGDPVWRQPKGDSGIGRGEEAYVAPFHFDSRSTRAQSIESLDHSWKGSHELWKNYDGWVPAKGDLTMGYFKREDIPFYYALADAFTICDGYHASIHGPTNPNRLYLFTGTNGLTVGRNGRTAIANPPDEVNETADQANDSPAFKPLDWTTYAERLQSAGVSWKVYQEYDNYGDNGLAYFAQFRGLDPLSPLHKRARAWVAGSTPENAKTSEGEFLIRAFARDVAADALPQVSWLVPPYQVCEHPDATPAYGESFVARLIEALAANPEVWAKTVLLINYDENDGFFDHVPPPLPAVHPGMGKSTVDVTGEIYDGAPVGLGPRVPMLAISPWSKGGFVNSQIFDHTSVIRFLERRFGVMEPQISPWRRAVCGDLTSVFDFETPNTGWRGRTLPDAAALPARALAARILPAPVPPGVPVKARQEPGRRASRPLPYAFEIEATAAAEGVRIRIVNTGAAGAGFNVYSRMGDGPWFYTVEAGQALEDVLPCARQGYDLTVHGPNGFLRGFRAARPDPLRALPEVSARFETGTGALNLALKNQGAAACTLRIASLLRPMEPAKHYLLAPGGTIALAWPLARDDHWFDLAVTSDHDKTFLRRLAGHGETGRPSYSDPRIGRTARPRPVGLTGAGQKVPFSSKI